MYNMISNIIQDENYESSYDKNCKRKLGKLFKLKQLFIK